MNAAKKLRVVTAPVARNMPLTPRQRAILRYLHWHVRTHGMPPTVRDVMTAFQIRSPNGAVYHLNALIGRGLIEVSRTTARGIRLVGARLTLEFTPDEAVERLRRALEDEPS